MNASDKNLYKPLNLQKMQNFFQLNTSKYVKFLIPTSRFELEASVYQPVVLPPSYDVNMKGVEIKVSYKI